MTRFGLFLIWLLHWLPLSLLAALGRCVGALLYMVAGERRRVVLFLQRRGFPLDHILRELKRTDP